METKDTEPVQHPTSPPERDDEAGSLFDAGESFARMLLEENGRLRDRIEVLESTVYSADGSAASRLPQQLKGVLETLEAEHQAASHALQQAELQNHRLAARCVEVETEYNTLGSLYVATHQLHATLDIDKLLRTLVEVAINLIGAEVLAVYTFDERRRKLVAVASEGAPAHRFPIIEIGSGPIGRAASTGEIHCVEATRSDDLERPIICIPFRREREPLGAIAIYALLRQKAGISPLDRELFSLLAGHAATAIYTAQLYSESKRKLDTMQGFLELMRPAPPRDARGPALPSPPR